MIVDFLLDKLPDTHVTLLALLPRGKSSFVQPSVFSGAINGVNAGLK